MSVSELFDENDWMPAPGAESYTDITAHVSTDGGIARIAFLDAELVTDNTNPELANLIKRRRALEAQAEEHKQLKGVMPDAEWNAQFEKLMLELAQVSAEIRKKS